MNGPGEGAAKCSAFNPVSFDSIILPCYPFSFGYDFFIAKYDSSGNIKWAIRDGGNLGVRAHSISADLSSNVFVSGIIQGDTAVIGKDTLISAGNYDGFIARYDTAGNSIWAKRIGCEEINSFQYQTPHIVADPTGNGDAYYFGNSTSDTILVGKDTLLQGTLGLLSFLIKFDSSGNIVWHINSKNANGRTNGINMDVDQNIYLTGNLSNTLNFYSTPINPTGVYVVKLCGIPASVPTISQNGNTLVSSSATGNQWYFNGYIISGATSQNHNPIFNANYVVQVTDTNGCNATSLPFNYSATGISENKFPDSFLIYPNPTNGTFTIQSLAQISNIEIVNVLGEEIYSSEINSFQKKVDLSSQPNGIYFLNIKTAQGTSNKKLIINK